MPLEIDLSGRLALVTGGSRGIGFGVAKVFAKAGADVIIVARDERRLREAKEEIREAAKRRVWTVSFDLTDTKRLPVLVDEVFSIGSPDIFFFSTGGPRPGSFLDLELEDWEGAVRLLLYPAVYISRRLIPAMMERGWGRLIYLTSSAIKEPVLNIALSSVVRVSLAGLVRTLAREVGRYGITVNGIMPGIIRTRRVEEIARDIADRRRTSLGEAYRFLAEDIPLGRLGEPEEIGFLAAFLASDLGGYINGAMIPVDGGKLKSIF